MHCAPSPIHVWLCAAPWTSSPGSAVHGILQAGILEWVAMHFSRGSSWRTYVSWITGGFSLTQELNPALPHCRRILYHLSHQGSPRILEWVAHPVSRGTFWPRNQTGVPCTADGFFTSWATGEAHSSMNRYQISRSNPTEHVKVFSREKLYCKFFKKDKQMFMKGRFDPVNTLSLSKLMYIF